MKNNKAIEYFLKAISIFENLDHTKGLLLAKTGLATAYKQSKQYESAQQICNQIVSQPNKNQYRGYAFMILGDIETAKTDFPQALNFYERGFNAFNEGHIHWGLVSSTKKKAATYFLMKDYQKSASLYHTIENEGEQGSPPLFI